MWGNIRKAAAMMLAAAILLVSVNIPAGAAETAETDPYYKRTYAEMYDNLSNKGVYTVAVKNLKKGYTVKWSILGGGKAYASLAERTTKAVKTAVINKVTVNSNGESLEGKRIGVRAKVYDTKNKLIKTLSMIAALKCKAESIDIDTTQITDVSGGLDRLTAGHSYELTAIMSPANATSAAYWEITDAKGTHYDDEITAGGVWTPQDNGVYTITAYAKNSPDGKVLCRSSIQAEVRTYMETVTQTASNKFEATFNGDVSGVYKASDFTVESDSASLPVKQVKYSQDGKTAIVTVSSNFTDGTAYTVACGQDSGQFAASVGAPVALSLLTSEVQAEKETPLEAALYDAQGIDVTNTVDAGAFFFEGEVTNGILNKETNALYMQTPGKTARITVSYNKGTVKLSDTRVITCTEAYVEEADTTKFTITDSVNAPDFQGEDVRTVAVGDVMYAHFAGLDENGDPIAYDTVTYASSDVDALIVNKTSGRITPIKSGAVNITVTVSQGSRTLDYTFAIMVSEGRKLAGAVLEKSSVVVSNVYEMDYQEKIRVTGRDQYGDAFGLTEEAGAVFETSNRAVLATYDAEQDAVIIHAQGASVGVYQYVLELTRGSVSVMANFTVIVQEPSYNGTVTYGVIASDDTVDMAVGAQTAGEKTVTLKVAEYRGGVFYGYKYFTNAYIQKGNRYYAADLKQSGASPILAAGSDTLTLTPVIFKTNPGETIPSCQKAETGTYIVTFHFLSDSGADATVTASVELTDSQKAPGFTIRSQTAEKRVKTATELVRECIAVTDGTITGCTVTGTELAGDAVSVSAGEQIHIKQITVRTVEQIANGTSVYMEHVININKTLENHA